MFDVGFSELLVIAVVALVVIGPERLPRVARTVGHLYGRLQRYVTQVKSDINREMEAADLGNVKAEFESAARSFKSEVESQAGQFEREVHGTRAELERDLSAKAAGEAPPAAPSDAAEPAPSPQLELGIEPPSPREDARPPAGA